MKKASQFLHTPPGSKPLYKEEAILRSQIRKNLIHSFEKWSFFPVETPVVDYYDVYAPFLSDKQKKGTLRFVNRDGDLVLLRNDITLFAAKALASRGTGIEETLKYYYADQIMRSHEKDSPEEYYQIGCEIVFNELSFEEAELVTVLIESTRTLGVHDFLLHIGDISVFKSMMTGFSDEQTAELMAAIRVRNIPEVRNLVNALSASEQLKSDLLTLSGFIGSINEFMSLKLNAPAANAVTSFKELLGYLDELGYADEIVVDFSELTDLDYYNGIIFNLYSPNAETPIASGGRYDNLFTSLGKSKKAVGFSYWLYPLEKILAPVMNTDVTSKTVALTKNTFTRAMKDAIQLTKQGESVRLHY